MPYEQQKLFLQETHLAMSALLKRAIKEIDATDFEKKVWLAACGIPRGEVRSYSWIAKKIHHPGASRAVGTALKNNILPLIIPCHRVVRSGGDIGNYGYGRKMKEYLLKFEGAI
jgi:O-6-methylguanine DNA methyltransferase